MHDISVHFNSSTFVKLHVIRFSVGLIYVSAFRSGNSQCLLELYNVLFVKSICRDSCLKTISPIMKGTLIGTTFVWNSRNGLFGRRCLLVKVNRLL